VSKIRLDKTTRCLDHLVTEISSRVIKKEARFSGACLVPNKLHTLTDRQLIQSLILFVLVVYRSSETSTNQSDVIIRSDDRFLDLVVDSDSIVSKIYMLNFVLWLVIVMDGCYFILLHVLTTTY
jgi:hypothetical protein